MGKEWNGHKKALRDTKKGNKEPLILRMGRIGEEVATRKRETT